MENMAEEELLPQEKVEVVQVPVPYCHQTTGKYFLKYGELLF